MKRAVLLLSLFLIVSLSKVYPSDSNVFHYYCTAADERHFTMLMNLIGNIHKNDFYHLDQIAVFDLGLTQEQRETLSHIEKTKVYAVEQTHPDLCTYFQTNAAGRQVRGWFAWKPVILKQALDLFPYVLYLDSGTLVLNSPDSLFKHIEQNGCYLMHIAPNSIEERITKPVIEKVLHIFSKEEQEFLLQRDTPMIDAGFQGVSRALYQKYVHPLYLLSSNLELFADDGSARLGFGAGRHDQTLFSIFAHKEKLKLLCQGWTELCVDGKKVPFHSHWNRADVNDKTCIYRSRGDYHYAGDGTLCIHWNESPKGQL